MCLRTSDLFKSKSFRDWRESSKLVVLYVTATLQLNLDDAVGGTRCKMVKALRIATDTNSRETASIPYINICENRNTSLMYRRKLDLTEWLTLRQAKLVAIPPDRVVGTSLHLVSTTTQAIPYLILEMGAICYWSRLLSSVQRKCFDRA